MARSRIERIVSAKKAVKTRRNNQAEMKYMQEVVIPGNRRFNSIVRMLLQNYPGRIRLRWNPTRDTGHKLKNGAQYGQLIDFVEGRMLKVLPDGYKTPKVYHPAFWELLL